MIYLSGFLVGRLVRSFKAGYSKGIEPNIVVPEVPQIETDTLKILREEHRLNAVKYYRNTTGAALRDSLNYVLELEKKYGINRDILPLMHGQTI